MFDRLYRLVIHNAALPEKVLVITGDSAKPSLGLDFSVTVNQSYVATNGQLTIYGLTTEHIGLLSAIRRYEYAKNAAQKNTATLSVGWRDTATGEESPLTVILHGTIIEATPGPLPERSLSMSIFASALNTVIPDKSEVIFKSPKKSEAGDANGVKIKDWLEGAAAAIAVGSDYSIDISDTFGSFPKIENSPYPTTLEEFKTMAKEKGCVCIEEEATIVLELFDESKDNIELQKKTILHVSGEAIPVDKGLIKTVSQETGMIGIPRSILMGAEVSVVLKDIIHPGTVVNLQTEMFPKLSSDPELYTNDGVYLVMSTRLSGKFHGDEWMQTLTLNRGGSILKKK